ncbi:peptidoglycan-binding domain-containing protein [Chroococcidiopsis thermalis]|uniref:Peptidoglycan-binding domain 1 protein n=1 Tax=Chroococcidiopsis thermalis (strain PCC 7203) TaxID=251229 RepID=K9UAR5_CHRTP|nr:peptidoglycan-binding domain-containing protein [Chroococcidiopsis thermalis]AFY91284.1 Peptidoglycan-binding domain 1 protein [Chroococcidiopsis thermalis PCC 7203]
MKTSAKIALTVASIGIVSFGGLLQSVSARQSQHPVAVIPQHDSPAKTPVLKIGSKGAAVAQAQKILKQEGFYKGAINGVFSSEMQSAVIAFQKSERIKPSGVIDSKTQAALR